MTRQAVRARFRSGIGAVDSVLAFVPVSSNITLLGTAATGTASSSGTVGATHTLAAGGNRIAIAFVHQTYYNAGEVISGVTYGGNAMTNITGVGVHTSSYRYLSAWYILEASLPTDGSKTVTATFGASVLTAAISVFTIQDAKQQPHETSNTYRNDGGASASSIAITTVAANAWAFSCGAISANTTFTHGTGQTEITDVPLGGTDITHSVSYEEIASPGAVTQVDTAGISDRMLGVAFSFAPF